MAPTGAHGIGTKPSVDRVGTAYQDTQMARVTEHDELAATPFPPERPFIDGDRL